MNAAAVHGDRAETRTNLLSLVGTVCPACRSEILYLEGHGVFCWDPYCGQQKDAWHGRRVAP